MKNELQAGKTRWCHYNIAYHFVWIPKSRRKVLRRDVQKSVKFVDKRLLCRNSKKHIQTIIRGVLQNVKGCSALIPIP